MQITLCAIDTPLITAWNDSFRDVDDVEVTTKNILQIPADAIVSPANSFGFMDGGFDWTLTQRFGTKVQERLQTLLKEHYWGELPVGMAVAIPTDDPIIGYCISAPTMRVPMILGPQSINAYLAARAAFIRASELGFKHITMTGLGTGVGRVPPDVCAKQMRQAYDDIFTTKRAFPTSWQEAQKRHILLTSNNIRDLQYHA